MLLTILAALLAWCLVSALLTPLLAAFVASKGGFLIRSWQPRLPDPSVGLDATSGDTHQVDHVTPPAGIKYGETG